MLCLSGFELYSRWVPLITGFLEKLSLRVCDLLSRISKLNIHFINITFYYRILTPLSASSPQRPLFFLPVYSPYIIALCLNLSTTATSLHAATTTSRA